MHTFYNKDNAFLDRFVQHTLRQQPYQSTGWMGRLPRVSIRGGRGLTGWMMPNKEKRIQRESTHKRYTAPDGGTICTLTYAPKASPSIAEQKKKTIIHPVLVFLTTFGTDATEFEQEISAFVDVLGWTVIVFHRRGLHCPMSTP